MSNTARGIQYPVGSDSGNLATHFSNLATTADSAVALDAGYKNIFINGGFDIWQRGTSHNTNNTFAADRWQVSTNVDSFSASQIVLGAGATLPAGFKHGYTISNTNGGTADSYTVIQQLIENVHTCNGLTVTVSFWAKANSGAPTLGMSFDQVFGTGGSPTGDVQNASFGNPTLTGSWARYSYTTTIPALPSSFTLGTSNNDYLRFVLWLSAGSNRATRSGNIGYQNVNISIAGLQMEVGPAATAFERRPIGVELALCQRYYEKRDATMNYGNDLTNGISYHTGAPIVARWDYIVEKRSNGTISYPFNGSTRWVTWSGAQVFGSLTMSTSVNRSKTGAVLATTTNSPQIGAGWLDNFIVVCDAELPT
jgi:hypothetical protein